MSDKTPKRATNNSNLGFSPITLPESPAQASPQKNLTGLPRIVRDLAADVYNTIQRWNDLHIKGATIVKEIASIKSDDPRDFSENLEKLANSLYDIVQVLHGHKTNLSSLAAQMRASEKMQQNQEPLFISLDVGALSKLVEDVAKAYDDEFSMKKIVLENIAHSKNKNEAMFLAALWTYQTKIGDNIAFKLETLLIETGHRKIN